jgi:D-glycero-alpha-D-manno-heptose 1-phosphate guanylyltransferase
MRLNYSLPLSGIDAAILVGGLGTRLRGVVDDVPKPLAPVLGRPFLYYLLDMLARYGVRSITLCSGYLAELVRDKVGDEWLGIPIHHSVEDQPLGTAGALALAKGFLKSDRVLVMNGDTWLEPDFTSFRQLAQNCDCCIASVRVTDASRYGLLEYNRSGRLIAFREKSCTLAGPRSINAGVYFLSQPLLSTLPKCRMSLETHILPGLVAEGRVLVFESTSPFLDIGIPSDYAAASDFLAAMNSRAGKAKSGKL